MLQNRQGNWFDLITQIAVLTLHVFCMTYTWLDYYSDYMKDEVKMMHGALGKARQRTYNVAMKTLWKVVIWERQGGGKDHRANFINMSMFRVG